MNPPARVAAAIIAGGQGTRLGGQTKSALSIGGRTIFHRQVEVLRPRFSRIMVVTAGEGPWSTQGLTDDAGAPLPMALLADRHGPGHGPLAGIDAALAALRPEEDGVVCVGSDMPFLSGDLLAHIRDAGPGADVVLPRVAGFPEPLLARYGRACGPAVASALTAGRWKVTGFLEEPRCPLRVHWLEEGDLRAFDPDLVSFMNVNTPADLAQANRLAGPAKG